MTFKLEYRFKISGRKRSEDIVRNSEREHKSRTLGLGYVHAEGFLSARHFAECFIFVSSFSD